MVLPVAFKDWLGMDSELFLDFHLRLYTLTINVDQTPRDLSIIYRDCVFLL